MGALEGIGALLGIVNQLLPYIKEIETLIKEHNLQDWVNDLQASIDELKKAETPEAKANVAKKLADLIHNLK